MEVAFYILGMIVLILALIAFIVIIIASMN
jgi:hypothetical protein